LLAFAIEDFRRGFIMSVYGSDLNLLVALKTLLEEANVTRAGERLGISQSSMSTALARLRVQFNDELLVRVGRDYELTPQARLLLPQLQKTIPLIQKALKTDGDFQPATATRSFRMVMSDYSAIQMNRLFNRILEDAPWVEFEIIPLHETPSDGPHELWINDFGIGPSGMGFEGESIDLFQDQYVCVIDQNNPALVHGKLSWEAFDALPQVTCSFGVNQMTPAERLLRDVGHSKRPNIITRSYLPIPAIVSGTDQVGIIPARLARSIPKSLNVALAEPPFGKSKLHQRLWWDNSKADDPAHAWLRKAIVDNLKLLD
jgi:DNA-binding transcriptional LysR family regulator